jgi:hypothetical protein
MHEHLTAASGPGPWSGLPDGGSAPADGQAWSYSAAISEIASAIGDTRWLVLISGGLLASDIAGAAVAVAELLGRRDAVAVGSVGLLVPVMLSWLVTAALLLLADRPVAGALGELRRVTGAQIDPSAPWLPLGVRPLPASDLEWSHVVPLIAAVTIRHARARLALSSAILTTAGLLLWMVLSLAIAAVI